MNIQECRKLHMSLILYYIEEIGFFINPTIELKINFLIEINLTHSRPRFSNTYHHANKNLQYLFCTMYSVSIWEINLLIN